jgi:hypothetical protein
MLIFVGFPAVRSGPRAKVIQHPLSLWTNGASSALAQDKLCELLLGVPDITRYWNRDRHFLSIAAPAVTGTNTDRPDKQMQSIEKGVIDLVYLIVMLCC